MNRRIPNGAYCVFRHPVEGSRNGRVVLVEHHDIADPETGGTYTIKIYERVGWVGIAGWDRHADISLKPDSTDARFQPVVLTDAQEDDVRVIAELVEVLAS
jgi:hypothetical protein